MNAGDVENSRVIAYLTRNGRTGLTFAPPDSVAQPYYRLGSHPDVVERIWDQLGRALPTDCRCIFCGTPALVHPRTNIVLAFACGTRYCLRLPRGLAEAAVAAGAPTRARWTTGGEMDTRRELGPEWVFGDWSAPEFDWLRRAYEGLSGDPPAAEPAP